MGKRPVPHIIRLTQASTLPHNLGRSRHLVGGEASHGVNPKRSLTHCKSKPRREMACLFHNFLVDACVNPNHNLVSSKQSARGGFARRLTLQPYALCRGTPLKTILLRAVVTRPKIAGLRNAIRPTKDYLYFDRSGQTRPSLAIRPS